MVAGCSDTGNCCGGWHATTLEYIMNYGVPDEGCMSYVDGSGCWCNDDGTCNSGCTYRVNACSDRTCSNRCSDWASRLKYIVSTGAVSASQDAIKAALVEHGPLAVAMGIGTDEPYFGYYDGDIYRCSSDGSANPGANHAVIIVGYDDAGEYWWVRNSWGTGFGESGYFKLGYGG